MNSRKFERSSLHVTKRATRGNIKTCLCLPCALWESCPRRLKWRRNKLVARAAVRTWSVGCCDGISIVGNIVGGTCWRMTSRVVSLLNCLVAEACADLAPPVACPSQRSVLAVHRNPTTFLLRSATLISGQEDRNFWPFHATLPAKPVITHFGWISVDIFLFRGIGVAHSKAGIKKDARYRITSAANVATDRETNLYRKLP